MVPAQFDGAGSRTRARLNADGTTYIYDAGASSGAVSNEYLAGWGSIVRRPSPIALRTCQLDELPP